MYLIEAIGFFLDQLLDFLKTDLFLGLAVFFISQFILLNGYRHYKHYKRLKNGEKGSNFDLSKTLLNPHYCFIYALTILAMFAFHFIHSQANLA